MRPVILEQPCRTEKGFTLIELLIAVVISLSIGSAAGNLLISQIRSGEKAEALAQQRSDWLRTSSFIEAEVALSEQVYAHEYPFTNDLAIAVPDECNISDAEVRLQLDLRRDLPPVIYAVQGSTSGWLPDYSLWRCGPSINEYGEFCTEDDTNDATSTCFDLPFVSTSLLLDGLSGNQNQGYGFLAQGSTASGGTGDNKYVRFTLALKGYSAMTYTQTDAARARVSPLYSRPTENSLCGAANMVSLRGSSGVADTNATLDIPNQNLIDQDVLICGDGYGADALGLTGDEISGADNTNDIIEAGDYGQASLSGLGGNDFLRGTLEADTLSGGTGDDILVGRDGDDELNGGSGQNTYLAGAGDDSINGGSGLDIAFFAGERANYTLDGSCSATSCTISGSGESEADGEDVLSGVEILIFQDARVDLED